MIVMLCYTEMNKNNAVRYELKKDRNAETSENVATNTLKKLFDFRKTRPEFFKKTAEKMCILSTT